MATTEHTASETPDPNRGRRKPALATLAVRDQILACCSFPGMQDLASLLPSPQGNGRRSDYPPVCLLAILCAARAMRGLNTVTRELASGDGALWSECADAMYSALGVVVPCTPPTRDQLMTFRQKFRVDEMIDALEDALRKSGMALAKVLGNFPDNEPDFAHPDPRNTIRGDGTVIGAYSDVTAWVHPRTGEVIAQGSRAQVSSSARIQNHTSDLTQDSKAPTRGLNCVSMHTRTPHGRVILGTAHALGSETWAAMDLIDEIARIGGGAVHNLVYDGLINGWMVDYLMAVHRIQTVNEVPAASRTDPFEHDSTAAIRPTTAVQPSADQLRMRLADEGIESAGAQLLAYERAQGWRELASSGKPLPVGVSVYGTRNGGGSELVYSRAYPTPPASHHVDGHECVHELVVDDGALHVIAADPVLGEALKVASPPCVRATATQGPDGRWTRTSVWRISCPNGDFDHHVSSTPNGTRYTAEDAGKKKPTDHGAADLRPLPRNAAAYQATFGERNDTESYNQWFKQQAVHHDRAMSLALNMQRLDFLCGAVLNNAITFYRYRESTRRRFAIPVG